MGRGGAGGRAGEDMAPQFLNKKKVPQFQFQTSEILLFTAATSHFFLTTKGNF